MREFFRGWKRKLGVVMLVLTCVIAGAWVRSFAKAEGWGFCKNLRHYERIVSTNGAIRFDTIRSKDLIQITMTKVFDLTGDLGFVPFEEKDVEWKWYLSGLGTGDYHSQTLKGLEMTIWRIPYWSIVIPLTALSAWLLLSKRHCRSDHRRKLRQNAAQDFG